MSTSQIPESAQIIISKSTEVVLAEEAAQIAAIKRKARIDAIEDYVGLVVSKGAGLAGIVTGAIVLIKPNALPLTTKQGVYALGGGIALLAGKKAIALLAKISTGG